MKIAEDRESPFDRNVPSSALITERIQATRPYLTSLALQLCQNEPEHWNVIIGDDLSGRLPTRFVRQVLRTPEEESAMPTHFVIGSRLFRSVRDDNVYDDYLGAIRDQIGEPLRPLIVTESISSGETVSFLRDKLTEYSDEFSPEIVAVAASEDIVERGEVDYYGGSGRTALKDIADAYEHHPSLSLPQHVARTAFRALPRTLQQRLKASSSLQLTPPTPNYTVGLRQPSVGEKDHPTAMLLELGAGDTRRAAIELINQMADDFKATQK